MKSAYDDPRVSPAMFRSNAQRFGADEQSDDARYDGDEFDPNQHTVEEVRAYLDSLEDPAEYNRVIGAEDDGKARKGVLDMARTAQVPEDAEPVA